MVVIRFVGDDWQSDERIVCSLQENRPISAQTSRITSALELNSFTGWCMYHTEGQPGSPQFRFTIPVNMNLSPPKAGLGNGKWVFIRKADRRTQLEDQEKWAKELEVRAKVKQLESIRHSNPDAYRKGMAELFPPPQRPGTACPKLHPLIHQVIENIPRSGLTVLMYAERKCARCNVVTPLEQPVWFCGECVWELCVTCRDTVFQISAEREEETERLLFDEKQDEERCLLFDLFKKEYDEAERLASWNARERIKLNEAIDRLSSEEHSLRVNLLADEQEVAHELTKIYDEVSARENEIIATQSRTTEIPVERLPAIETPAELADKIPAEHHNIPQAETVQLPDYVIESAGDLLKLLRERDADLIRREEEVRSKERWLNLRERLTIRQQQLSVTHDSVEKNDNWLHEARIVLAEAHVLTDIIVERRRQDEFQLATAKRMESAASRMSTSKMRFHSDDLLHRALQAVGLEQHYETFAANEITVDMFQELSDDDLAVLGLSDHHRRLFAKLTKPSEVREMENQRPSAAMHFLNELECILENFFSRHDASKIQHAPLLIRTFKGCLDKLAATLIDVYNPPESPFSDLYTDVLSSTAPHFIPFLPIILDSQQTRELEWLDFHAFGENNPGDWTEFVDANGSPYYHHARFNASQWTRPRCLQSISETKFQTADSYCRGWKSESIEARFEHSPSTHSLGFQTILNLGSGKE